MDLGIMQPVLAALVPVLLLSGAADTGLTWLRQIGSTRDDDLAERF